MPPPVRLDEHGQPVSTHPCPKCGRDSPEHRYRFEHLRMIGWAQPRQVLKIVNWCGHSQDFVAWPDGDGYWTLVPVVGSTWTTIGASSTCRPPLVVSDGG
jgi:hypothetical protein